MGDLTSVLAYYNTSREDRDYSYIANAKHQDMEGVCIYCNHCQPCPVGIDIGAVNKYLDLANAGDELAKDHYLKLARHAGACTGCGADAEVASGGKLYKVTAGSRKGLVVHPCILIDLEVNIHRRPL